MKNLHLISTDKPSRLHFDDKIFLSPRYQLSSSINSIVEGKNIYITNDEPIKERDWYLDTNDYIISKAFFIPLPDNCKKIILTDNKDLVQDGVQAIDDEFLEWFVKNSSCEEVEVEELISKNGRINFGYQAVIPKEETNYNMKQEILTEMERLKQEPKQETIEEAAHKNDMYLLGQVKEPNFCYNTFSFIEGAKWQQQRMYSEEDMKKAFNVGRLYLGRKGDTNFEQFIEQFKNKQDEPTR